MKKSLVLINLMLLAGSFLFLRAEAKADWTYTVGRGDTIYNIAQRTGVTAGNIKQRNGYWSDALKIGQRLIIPTVTAQAPPTRTSGDLDLLSRVINAEAGAEPYVGKVAVGGVIMNRIQDPKFPKSIAGIVYQPGAFESVSNGTIYQPASSESLKAATDALSGWDPSGGALYFFNPAKAFSAWIWSRPIINQIGRHVFAL